MSKLPDTASPLYEKVKTYVLDAIGSGAWPRNQRSRKLTVPPLVSKDAESSSPPWAMPFNASMAEVFKRIALTVTSLASASRREAKCGTSVQTGVSM